jgi:hypothetical protein
MRRGFMLTAITVILFMVLIDTAFQYSKSSSAYSERISEMIVSEKISYDFDDITEDISKIVGFTVTQQASDLIIQDSMPGINITRNLALYENFLRSYYITPEMELKFMNANGQPITLNNLSNNISVTPFNLTYGYSDFGKNSLLMQVPLSQSLGVQNMWYNISITSSNFENVSNITWNPAPLACMQGSQGCMKFYMAINDSNGTQYIESNYNFFSTTLSAAYLNVSFVNPNCWIRVQVGSQYLLNLTNNGCNLTTQIGFNFNTSNLDLNFPEKLSIRDVNYNTSKQDNINVIVTKLLR